MDQPENPNESYRPPPIEEHGSVARQPLSVRAILSGVIVDWVATFASWTLISVMAAAVAASRYSSVEQMQGFLAKLGQSPDFVILTAIVGLACVALGGFASGKLARRDEVRHALLTGAVSLVIGIAVETSNGGEHLGWSPLWFRWLGHILVIPAAVFGGVVAAARETLPDGSG